MLGRPNEERAALLALLAVLGCDRRDKSVERALPPAPAVQAVAPAAIEDAGPPDAGVDARADGSSRPLPVEVITSLGYAVRSSASASPTSWERHELGLLRKDTWTLKSERPMKGNSDTYYRYTLSVEDYPVAAVVAARVKRCNDKPPGLGPEEDKAFPLRKCFAVGTSAWVLATDVAVFKTDGEMDRIAKALRAAAVP
jgi:hypothetical protein